MEIISNLYLNKDKIESQQITNPKTAVGLLPLAKALKKNEESILSIIK